MRITIPDTTATTATGSVVLTIGPYTRETAINVHTTDTSADWTLSHYDATGVTKNTIATKSAKAHLFTVQANLGDLILEWASNTVGKTVTVNGWHIEEAT